MRHALFAHVNLQLVAVFKREEEGIAMLAALRCPPVGFRIVFALELKNHASLFVNT